MPRFEPSYWPRGYSINIRTVNFVLLDHCDGFLPVSDGILQDRLVMWGFDIYFVVNPSNLLNKNSWGASYLRRHDSYVTLLWWQCDFLGSDNKAKPVNKGVDTTIINRFVIHHTGLCKSNANETSYRACIWINLACVQDSESYKTSTYTYHDLKL